MKRHIEESEGSLEAFSRGYQKFGFNVQSDGSVLYREWAPGAVEAYLIGDFSKTCLCFLCFLFLFR